MPSPLAPGRGPGLQQAGYPAAALRAAFTLIEVLAAVAVLSILVLFVGRMFNEASRAWRSGMRGAEQQATARMLLDDITRGMTTTVANQTTTFYFTDDYYASDLSRAIRDRDRRAGTPDERPQSTVEDTQIYSDVRSTALFTASINQWPGWHRRVGSQDLVRSLSQVCYSPYRTSSGTPLMRRWMLPAVGTLVVAHYHPEWPLAMPVGYEYARPAAFRVEAYELDPGGNPRSIDSGEYYSAHESDRLPLFADVLLDSLSEEQRRQLSDLSDQSDRDEFIRRNAQRHATRVFFAHRDGFRLDLR